MEGPGFHSALQKEWRKSGTRVPTELGTWGLLFLCLAAIRGIRQYLWGLQIRGHVSPIYKAAWDLCEAYAVLPGTITHLQMTCCLMLRKAM